MVVKKKLYICHFCVELDVSTTKKVLYVKIKTVGIHFYYKKNLNLHV